MDIPFISENPEARIIIKNYSGWFLVYKLGIFVLKIEKIAFFDRSVYRNQVKHWLMQKATILDQKSILIWCFSSVPVSAASFWQSKQIFQGLNFSLEKKKLLFFVSTQFDELLPSRGECLLLWKMTEEDLQWRCKEKAASIISRNPQSFQNLFQPPGLM